MSVLDTITQAATDARDEIFNGVSDLFSTVEDTFAVATQGNLDGTRTQGFIDAETRASILQASGGNVALYQSAIKQYDNDQRSLARVQSQDSILDYSPTLKAAAESFSSISSAAKGAAATATVLQFAFAAGALYLGYKILTDSRLIPAIAKAV